VRSALKLGVRQEKIGVKEGARKAQIHYLKDECAGVRRECAGEVVSECASDYRERRTHGEVEEVDGAANSNGALESRKCPECESLASKGIDSKCSKHFV
jgi:hypothetical protein